MSTCPWEMWEEHWALGAPWSEYVRGVLVRALGSPRTLHAYATRKADYLDSREGGGLWDEGMRQASIFGQARMPVGRLDNKDIQHWVETHSTGMPDRMLQVYILVVVKGRTHEQAAHDLGIRAGTVRTQMTRLKKRVRGRA